MVTPRQQDLLLFINSHLKTKGYAPTFREMMRGLGAKSFSHIQSMLDILEDEGYILREPNRPRNLMVLKTPQIATGCCPTCGSPSQ